MSSYKGKGVDRSAADSDENLIIQIAEHSSHEPGPSRVAAATELSRVRFVDSLASSNDDLYVHDRERPAKDVLYEQCANDAQLALLLANLSVQAEPTKPKHDQALTSKKSSSALTRRIQRSISHISLKMGNGPRAAAARVWYWAPKCLPWQSVEVQLDSAGVKSLYETLLKYLKSTDATTQLVTLNCIISLVTIYPHCAAWFHLYDTSMHIRDCLDNTVGTSLALTCERAIAVLFVDEYCGNFATEVFGAAVACGLRIRLGGPSKSMLGVLRDTLAYAAGLASGSFTSAPDTPADRYPQHFPWLVNTYITNWLKIADAPWKRTSWKFSLSTKKASNTYKRLDITQLPETELDELANGLYFAVSLRIVTSQERQDFLKDLVCGPRCDRFMP